MKLEAVIVCVNYSDFLAHTIQSTKNQFDQLVVVTDYEDLETKKLCEYYNVKCVQTNVFYENGDKFNKGKGINERAYNLENDKCIVQCHPSYLRPLEVNTLLGDSSKAQKILKWKAKIKLNKLVEEMIYEEEKNLNV